MPSPAYGEGECVLKPAGLLITKRCSSSKKMTGSGDFSTGLEFHREFFWSNAEMRQCGLSGSKGATYVSRHRTCEQLLPKKKTNLPKVETRSADIYSNNSIRAGVGTRV